MCRGQPPRQTGHSQQITNILIRIDGDHAASEAYVTATLRFEQDGVRRQATVLGRHLDRWSCRAGRWAVDHRHFVCDLDEVHDLAEERLRSWGHRDRDDPSYALFAFDR
ncbi:nuclear transport factor 2 family protein [Rhizorhabdus wittichii]|uniref:Nuclear transport factor 2 family protein n=1 Tax=Rhizorhabdus wittichii TaxID=160791 RepID=A0A975D1F2_9SPHN|nr:nuclear transport factor 2 family protein [Rhizorhabdus wittichii]